jgi:hypothetical protein
MLALGFLDILALKKMPATSRMNEETVATLLREHNGNLAAVGRSLKMTRGAVLAFVQKRPELAAICSESREAMKDHAESSLYRAVLAGEAWAVCFFLKTQARDRGYVERQEHAGANGAPLSVKVNIVDNGRDRPAS